MHNIQDRINLLNKITEIKEKQEIIYWMSRDQRVNDNWALIFANKISKEKNLKLKVIFTLTEEFLEAQEKQFVFLLEGLKLVEKKLNQLGIEFSILQGKEPSKEIINYLLKNKVSIIITDFDPLKIKNKWKEEIIKNIKIPFYQVDAHNIIPVWKTSLKQEYGAYTIRPKINYLLGNYLTEFPKIKKRKLINSSENNFKKLIKIKSNYNMLSGEINGKKVLNDFIENKLNDYGIKRNDPALDYQSNLSPYIHFGQISSQRIVLEVINQNKNEDSKKSFLEEIIVRKELADNYCYYNKNYDNFNGFPNWAKKTLNEHANDKRKYIYNTKELENSKTHDILWNAAQTEMIKTGKMHGYLRMYWAKKILEWTENIKNAQKTTIFLNDKYSIDGRDPNGYSGIAWALGGVHDRAWNQRAIFGKIRYMSFNSTSKKFNLKAYLEKINKIN